MSMVDRKTDKPQIDKFKDAARELETDDREEVFDEKLKKVAKPKPQGDRPKAR